MLSGLITYLMRSHNVHETVKTTLTYKFKSRLNRRETQNIFLKFGLLNTMISSFVRFLTNVIISLFFTVD